MAIMIPDSPREYDERSREDIMFEALEQLPDDYYVIHSFKQVYIEDNVLKESEADFLVFNPHKGIITFEAKATKVRYEDGRWKYGSGLEMPHGGPYNQANRSKHALIDRIKNGPLNDIYNRIKILHAVWFPMITEKEMQKIPFPAEADKAITMTKEALVDPQLYIDRIFSLDVAYGKKTDISALDTKRLLRDILCPAFNIFPASNFDVELKKTVFHRLLKEQTRLLNYLEEQKSAVINGAAGTGKTMIAVTKALGHAKDGERVLFLCYNRFLRDYLEKTYAHNNIDFLTIDKFACTICNTEAADYELAKDRIVDMYLSGTFPYKHVIVDEAQDFGKEKIEESNILETIYETVMDNDSVDGTFYVFYDKLQLIQAEELPAYIVNADCKLTLYKNCRNTENIAITSLKPISSRSPKLREGSLKGALAKVHYQSDRETISDKTKELIEDYKKLGITDVVVLTPKSEESSVLTKSVKRGKINSKTFTTCKKFKGLEADAIIIVDVDESTFDESNVLDFYVGTSRARLYLDIITTMDDEACEKVLANNLNYTRKIRRPKKEFASALNAMPVVG